MAFSSFGLSLDTVQRATAWDTARQAASVNAFAPAPLAQVTAPDLSAATASQMDLTGNPDQAPFLTNLTPFVQMASGPFAFDATGATLMAMPFNQTLGMYQAIAQNLSAPGVTGGGGISLAV